MLVLLFLIISSVVGGVCQLGKNTLDTGIHCSSNCTLAIYYRDTFPASGIINEHLYTALYKHYKDCKCHCQNPVAKKIAIEANEDHLYPIEHVAILPNLPGHHLTLYGGRAFTTPHITFAEEAFARSALKIIVLHNFKQLVLPNRVFPNTVEQLLLHNIGLTEIPDAVLNTKISFFFFIGGNNIKTIPEKFEKSIIDVMNFGIGKNNFTEFPYILFKLKKLKEVNLLENPLKNIFLTPEEKETIENTYDKFLNQILEFNIDCNGQIEEVTPKKGSPFSACIVDSRIPDRSDDGSNKAGSEGSDNGRTYTPTSTSPVETSSGIGTGVIVGVIVCAIIVVLAITGVIVYFWIRSKQVRKDPYGITHSPSNTKSMADPHETPILGSDKELLLLYISGRFISLVRRVSKGSFGEVWLATYNGTDVAVKKLIIPEISRYMKSDAKYDKLSHCVQVFAEEIKLMSKLDHPRIVRLVGCSWTNVYDFVAVMEFVENGDLLDYLQEMNNIKESGVQSNELQTFTWIDQKLQISFDILEGLIYLHSLNPKVIHRDLKSRNVLLDRALRVKLTDFGSSRELEFDEVRTMTGGIGTVYWMAPEVLKQERIYTEAVDVYSLGVILTELDTLKMPYHHLSPHTNGSNNNIAVPYVNIPGMVISGEVRPLCSNECPSFISNLVAKCLVADPMERPTVVGLFHLLQEWKISYFQRL